MDNLEKIKEFFERIAPERDRWKKKNRYYYWYMEDQLLPFLVPPGKKVLEIGCGTGDLLAKLKPARGLGIDISQNMVEIASQKYGSDKTLEFSTVGIEDIKEKFDYVVLSDVIGYVTDAERMFRSLHGIARPRSRIIITHYSQLWEPVLEFGSKVGLRMPSLLQSWLTSDDIENLLYLCGFEVIKKGRKLLLPGQIPVLSLFFNKFLVNIFPFSKLNLVNFLVARPTTGFAEETGGDKKIPAARLALAESRFKTARGSFCVPSVSIVVPARNEAGMIKRIVEELPELGSKTELIFIEGHSNDGTLEEIKKVISFYKGPKIIKYAVQDGRGKGDAVRKGFEIARGDILMIYDADMTVPPAELEKFYNALVSGRGEFINGSRLVYPMEKQSMRILNYVGNKFFSFMFSWLLGQKIKDTLCGTKVLWKKDYEDIKAGRVFFGDFDPFGDFDLLFGAAKLNLKIVDLPVHYRERTYGGTNISRWKHGWLLLKMVFFAMKKIKFI